MKYKLLSITILLFLLVFSQPILAQDNPTNPVYVIQPGETLFQIAQKFNVSVNEIVTFNNISNPDLISPGTRLYIPGLTGISGELTTHIVGVGENMRSISLKFQIPMVLLAQVNRITSPNEIYAGSNLIFSKDQAVQKKTSRSVQKPSQSVFEMAIILGSNPWKLSVENDLITGTYLLPPEMVFSKSAENSLEISSISTLLKSVSIDPLPLSQGNTVTIDIESSQQINFTGTLNGFDLHFFKKGENKYYALQGVHAMAEPGLSVFSLNGESSNGQKFSFQQMLLLKQTLFLKDPPIDVSDLTIDPAITKPEDEFVKGLISVISSDNLWLDKFLYPLDEPVCYKSIFGNRRSYNGSDYSFFHTGLDFGVCAPNLNIYASASGKVVFAGPLTVRGNAVFIDHGQGIFSGYFHASQINVAIGEMVQAHQKIGLVGSTGRVTGPHLHFEIWVNGAQVDPTDWFQNNFP